MLKAALWLEDVTRPGIVRINVEFMAYKGPIRVVVHDSKGRAEVAVVRTAFSEEVPTEAVPEDATELGPLRSVVCS